MDQEKNASSIKEGKEVVSMPSATGTKVVVPESTSQEAPLDKLFDIPDTGGLSRKPQETRVNEKKAEISIPSTQEASTPAATKATAASGSNFAESASVKPSRDYCSWIMASLKRIFVFFNTLSKSLELLSWFGLGICMWFSGAKFNSSNHLDSLVFIVIALLFVNNGIRLPNSIAGDIVRRMTRIIDK